MDRAAKAQENHWLHLFSGRFDETYLVSIRKIGLTHSRIGLDPQWYIGGYALILADLYELRRRCMQAGSVRLPRRRRPCVCFMRSTRP